MKKIFTLMLTFACAMFVGVSCTTDGPADNGGTTPPAEPTYDVVITVGELAEPFAANGGTATLSVTLSKDVIGANVVAETSATWLSASVNEDNKLVLEAAPFTAVTNPRSASVVVSYVDSNNNNLAAPVTVAASQVSPAPSFSVTWSAKTPVGATATITTLDTTAENMVWGAFTFGQSALEPSDDEGGMPLSTRAGVATKTPEEYAMEQIASIVAPESEGGWQMSGLYSGFYWLPQYGYPYFLSELNETVYCSLVSADFWSVSVEEKGYLCVVGVNKNNTNLENDVDDSTQATPIHIFEIEALPAPTVSVSVSEAEVNATEGYQLVTITVENPYDGVLSAYVDYSAESWVTPTIVDNKLHINYAANPYAVSRSAEVTVSYSYMCDVLQYGMMMPMDFNATATVKLTQKKNETVAPVTFEFEVVETHFDHILVNVTPSDLNATYVLGNIQKMGFDESYKGNWLDLAASQASNEPLTGAQTNYRLDVERYGNEDDSDPESWKYWVYAFAVDAEKEVAAGEASKTLVAVKNDRPAIECPEGFTMNGTTFYLDVYGKGGEFNVKLNVTNAPKDGYGFKLYDSTIYKRVDEIIVEDDTINHASVVFGNEKKVSVKDGYLSFTVNDFPTDWSGEGFDPFSSFSLYLTNADNTGVITTYTVMVRLHPAE